MDRAVQIYATRTGGIAVARVSETGQWQTETSRGSCQMKDGSTKAPQRRLKSMLPEAQRREIRYSSKVSCW